MVPMATIATYAGATADDPANQALLDEAHGGAHGKGGEQVEGLLNDPSRLASDEKGCRLTLSQEDIEWLLQVLNDVRVGSWLKAGCGPGSEDSSKITAANAMFFALIRRLGFSRPHFSVCRDRRGGTGSYGRAEGDRGGNLVLLPVNRLEDGDEFAFALIVLDLDRMGAGLVVPGQLARLGRQGARVGP